MVTVKHYINVNIISINVLYKINASLCSFPCDINTVHSSWFYTCVVNKSKTCLMSNLTSTV